jgi:DNA-binding NarL/FixJ family response regulator
MTESIRVLLVEDDAMVRGWVRLTLAGTEFDVIGEAAGADEAHALCARRRPQLLVIDYRLGDGLGTQLVKRLRESGHAAPAVLMTANAEEGFNELAREAGAQGTTLKTGSPDELLRTLRLARAGRPAFDSRHPRRAPGRAALSPREREVVRLIAAGATNREVAAALGVRPETVKTLLGRTFAKLAVRRRAEAVAVAHAQGML